MTTKDKNNRKDSNEPEEVDGIYVLLGIFVPYICINFLHIPEAIYGYGVVFIAVIYLFVFRKVTVRGLLSTFISKKAIPFWIIVGVLYVMNRR